MKTVKRIIRAWETVTHLDSGPRNRNALCGAPVTGQPDINWVTCDKCRALHEKETAQEPSPGANVCRAWDTLSDLLEDSNAANDAIRDAAIDLCATLETARAAGVLNVPAKRDR